MSDSSIPVKYINATNNTEFQVCVFAKNFSTSTPQVSYTAWQVLKAQTSVSFTYPEILAVGATYKVQGQEITAGPFPAKLGSTWEITQDSLHDTAVLKEKTGVRTNPNNAVVIKNDPPSAWTGRMFDIGVYKEGRLLLIEKNVRVGNQIDFVLQPKLYFGVVHNMRVGYVFESLDITTGLTEFDLSNFPNGIEVTLSQKPGGGQYVFTGESMI